MSGSGRIKAFIKKKCPVAVSIVRWLRAIDLRFESMESRFNKIYRAHFWGKKGSVSGVGSDLAQTAVISGELPALLKEINAKVLLDAPCGDFYWMRSVELDIDRYIGADIVPEIIAENRRKYGKEGRQFIKRDITKDELPRADVILCRDCLVHLSYKHIFSAIRNFKKSGSKYLLTTTFTERTSNENIVSGDWRTLNLQLPPFNFPEPIKIINEECPQADGKYSDKSLGLWRLEDIVV